MPSKTLIWLLLCFACIKAATYSTHTSAAAPLSPSGILWNPLWSHNIALLIYCYYIVVNSGTIWLKSFFRVSWRTNCPGKTNLAWGRPTSHLPVEASVPPVLWVTLNWNWVFEYWLSEERKRKKKGPSFLGVFSTVYLSVESWTLRRTACKFHILATCTRS